MCKFGRKLNTKNMVIGTFEQISKNYFLAGRNAYVYCNTKNILLRFVLYLIAIPIHLVMSMLGIGFYMFIIFDWISSLSDRLRNSIFNKMVDLQSQISQSFWTFLFYPIFLGLLTPIFFLSVLIPKFSSNIDSVSEEFLGGLSENGIFLKTLNLCLEVVKSLFVYVGKCVWIIKPIALIVAIYYSAGILLLGFIALIFTIVDMISSFIEWIRRQCVTISKLLAESISKGFFSFVFSAILMFIIAPIIAILLIVPKFSSSSGEA